jgi:ATP-dependent DNA helicase RecQ
MLRILRRAPGETVEELAASGGRSVRRTDAAVARLEELEAVEVGVDGSIRLRDGAADATELPAAAVAAQERRRRLARSRVDMIRAYAESSGCRRRFILNYFGEEYEPPCAACDNCVAGRAEGLSEDATTSEGSDAGLALNGPVRHTVFGAGMVSRLEGDRVVVLFEDAGYKTIDLTEAISRGLLAPEG